MSMLLPVLSLLMSCGTGIDIRVQDAAVDLTAKGVPTSAVLDCLAEKLEIKVVYLDGDPPSKPLTLNLKGQTVRQAIEQILLESQLNYAVGADKSGGTGIKTIVITGKKGPAAGPMPAQPTPYMDPYAGGGGVQEMPQAESTPEPSDPAPVPYPGQPVAPAGGTTNPVQPGYAPYPGAPGYPPPAVVAPGYPSAPGYPAAPTAVPGSGAPAPAYPGAPASTPAPGYSSPGMVTPVPATPTPGYSSPGMPTTAPTAVPGYPAPAPMSSSSGAYPAAPSASGTR